MPDAEEAFAPVLEAVRIVRRELGSDQALVGFCGGPFTVAGYLVEGRPSRDFVRVKELMYREPDVWHALMERLAECFSGYVAAKAAAGADAIQLFDSWVGVLSVADYEEFVAPYSARVLAAVDVPTIHFGTGTAHLLGSMAAAGGDGVGLDWRIPLDRGWIAVGADRAVQGNLDPAALLGPVGADRGGGAGRPRPGRRPPRPRLQPRPRRPARDRSRGSVAAGGAGPRADRTGRGVSAAVVLMAYGSPDRIEDVPAYYEDIRGGRPVRPELLADLTERYRRLGIEDSNPLNEITEQTRAALEAELGLPVFTGMKHWRPRIGDAAEAALATGAATVAGARPGAALLAAVDRRLPAAARGRDRRPRGARLRRQLEHGAGLRRAARRARARHLGARRLHGALASRRESSTRATRTNGS